MRNSKLTILFSRALCVGAFLCASVSLLGCVGANASLATSVPTRAQDVAPSLGGEVTVPPQTVSPGTGQDAPVNSQQTAPAKKSSGAKIVGHVLDDKGNPIARATVAISKGTAPYPERAYLTDENGMYAIGLPPGTFTVFVNAEGFEIAEQETQVEQNQETTLDFKLTPK